ncbi:hypothetical protein SNK04_002679 [Fusarium graminearum]|jgi:hypothetical protein
MVYAPNAAVGTTQPVNIAALKLVMAMHLASRARNDVKHVALTRDATRLAVNLALPVLRQLALPIVPIPSVLHPVLPLATGYPAL